jgi:carboxylesterase type B
VVIGGDSAGAASVTLLLTAYGGRDDHLFVGSTAESQSFATQSTVSQSQYQYDELVIRTACSNTTTGDTLSCLRSLTTAELQKVNINTPFPGAPVPPLYQYGPTIDNDLVPDYTYNLFTEGKFIKVPTIFGDDTNGGATFCPSSTANLTQSNNFLRDQFPALTLGEIWELNKLYEQTDLRFVDTGDYYRQCSNVYGDMRYTCPGLYLAKLYTKAGEGSWAYRYNVEDPDQVAAGLGVPHTVEVNAIWGPQYVTGTPPASYNEVNGSNRFIIPVIQGYWTSFIRSLDPNKYRYPGTPVWEEWTTCDDCWRRLKFQTNATAMEEVDEGIPGQKERCEYLISIGPGTGQ